MQIIKVSPCTYIRVASIEARLTAPLTNYLMFSFYGKNGREDSYQHCLTVATPLLTM